MPRRSAPRWCCIKPPGDAMMVGICNATDVSLSLHEPSHANEMPDCHLRYRNLKTCGQLDVDRVQAPRRPLGAHCTSTDTRGAVRSRPSLLICSMWPNNAVTVWVQLRYSRPKIRRTHPTARLWPQSSPVLQYDPSPED